MGSGSDLVSVILSFRDEEGNLPELLRRIALMADGRPESFEFILPSCWRWSRWAMSPG